MPARLIAALAVLAIGAGVAAALLARTTPLPRLTRAQQHYLALADQGVAKTVAPPR